MLTMIQPELTDEDVICAFMEPQGLTLFTGPDNKHPYAWWSWYCHTLSDGSRRHIPVLLTLDRLHQVEAKLTDQQWLFYGALCWKWYTEAETTNDYEVSHLNKWRRKLLHLTAEQKIKALAQVIRCTA